MCDFVLFRCVPLEKSSLKRESWDLPSLEYKSPPPRAHAQRATRYRTILLCMHIRSLSLSLNCSCLRRARSSPSSDICPPSELKPRRCVQSCAPPTKVSCTSPQSLSGYRRSSHVLSRPRPRPLPLPLPLRYQVIVMTTTTHKKVFCIWVLVFRCPFTRTHLQHLRRRRLRHRLRNTPSPHNHSLPVCTCTPALFRAMRARADTRTITQGML